MRYLTLREAAAIANTPAETIRYWIHLGRLRGFKPGRSLLVRDDDLEEYIAGSQVKGWRGPPSGRTSRPARRAAEAQRVPARSKSGRAKF
jgi:excisionase family DNA binding protein